MDNGIFIFRPFSFYTLLTCISQWSSLESCTVAPYTLSLKSNGCIIFIAALTPTKLLITSKHSVGPIPGAEISHSRAGEAWLRKYLVKKGKTEAELATRLWDSNLTAIAEVRFQKEEKQPCFHSFHNYLTQDFLIVV